MGPKTCRGVSSSESDSGVLFDDADGTLYAALHCVRVGCNNLQDYVILPAEFSHITTNMVMYSKEFDWILS